MVLLKTVLSKTQISGTEWEEGLASRVNLVLHVEGSNATEISGYSRWKSLGNKKERPVFSHLTVK